MIGFIEIITGIHTCVEKQSEVKYKEDIKHQTRLQGKKY
jgi:hypothetical protein